MDNPTGTLLSTLPETVSQSQLARYVILASLMICVWDWLLALSDEYEMVCKSTQRMGYLSDGVYFFARLSGLGYFTVKLVLTVSPMNDCQNIAYALETVSIITMPVISILFFMRASAVYMRNKIAIAIFGLSWLALCATIVYGSVGISSEVKLIDGTQQCMVARASTPAYMRTDGLPWVATALYDTLIYLAISWHLTSFSMSGDNWKCRIKSLVKGDGLLSLSKGLLHNGQIYYFTTITVTILTVAFTYSADIQMGWKRVITLPNVAIQTVMACRVCRELKLGMIEDTTTYPSPISVAFINISPCLQDIDWVSHFSASIDSDSRMSFDGNPGDIV